MSQLFRNKYRIPSARLVGRDYSRPGAYFVTICTRNRVCWFGGVQNGKMVLSDIGKIVHDEWAKTPKIRPNVKLDEFVVMPNHFHGILIIKNDDVRTIRPNVVETTRRVVSIRTTEPERKTTLKHNSLGSILGHFKSICTNRIRAVMDRELQRQ